MRVYGWNRRGWLGGRSNSGGGGSPQPPIIPGKTILFNLDAAAGIVLSAGRVQTWQDQAAGIIFSLHSSGVTLAELFTADPLLNNQPAVKFLRAENSFYWNNGNYGTLPKPFFDRNSYSFFTVFHMDRDGQAGAFFSESGDQNTDDGDRTVFTADSRSVAFPLPRIGFSFPDGENSSTPAAEWARANKLGIAEGTMESGTFNHVSGVTRSSEHGLSAPKADLSPVIQYTNLGPSNAFLFVGWQKVGGSREDTALAHIMIYPELTIAEQLTVERYISNRYGIAMKFVLTATPGTGFVSLSWTDCGVTNYGVERSTSASGPFTEIGTTAGLTFDDVELTGGITYYYRLTDKNDSDAVLIVPAVAATPAAVPAIPITSDLLAYYAGAAVLESSPNVLQLWIDQSGNFNNLSVIQGSVATANDGQQHLVFSGSGGTRDTLRKTALSSNLSNPATIFGVGLIDGTIINNHNAYWTDGTSGQRFAWGKANTGANLGRIFQGTLVDSPNSLVPYDEYFIQHAIFKTDPSVINNELWINGVFDYSNTGTAQNSSGLTVGGPHDLASNSYWFGKMRAVVVFNQELTEPQIIQILDFLSVNFMPSGFVFASEMAAVLTESGIRGAAEPSNRELIALQYFIEELKSIGVWSTADSVYLTDHSGDAEFKTINLKNPTGGRLVRPTAEISNDSGYGSTNELFNDTTPASNETISSAAIILETVAANDLSQIYVTNSVSNSSSRLHTGNLNLGRFYTSTNANGFNIATWANAGGAYYYARSTNTIFAQKDNSAPGSVVKAADAFRAFDRLGSAANAFQFSFFYRGAYMAPSVFDQVRAALVNWRLNKGS